MAVYILAAFEACEMYLSLYFQFFGQRFELLLIVARADKGYVDIFDASFFSRAKARIRIS